MTVLFILLSGDIGALVNAALMFSVPLSLIGGIITYRLVRKEVWLKILVALLVTVGIWFISMKAFFHFLTL